MNRPKTITNKNAEDITYWLDSKYKLVAMLAIETGLRISDILDLRKKDIKSPNMRIYEKKSRQYRKFKISENLHKKLKDFTVMHFDKDFIFRSSRTGVDHVHRTTIHRNIKKAIKWLKFDCSAHSLRKLYAMNVLTETGSIYAVQRNLNHQKLSTTLTYLDIPTPEVKI